MSRKLYRSEDIINTLRQAEVEVAKGEATAQVCKKVGISEQTYERWRREYNGFRPHSALGYRPPAPMAIMPLPRDFTPLHPVALASGLT